jgi:hypothetical protein
MAAHVRRCGARPGRALTALLAAADDPAGADRSVANGADLIDVSGMTTESAAVTRRRHSARVWDGPPGDLVDVDLVAAACQPGAAAAAAGEAGPAAAGEAGPATAGEAGPATAPGTTAADAPVAAVVAVAAIHAWLGSPVIRTRHVRQVRRAIDMASAIAGTRLPAETTRGLG